MAQSFVESAPIVTDITCGSSSANGGTLITVPIGRVWRGDIVLSAQANAASVVNGTPTVTVQGTGAVPTSGTVLNAIYVVSTATSTGTVSTQTVEATIASTTNAITLQLNTGGASAATGVAVGTLL